MDLQLQYEILELNDNENKDVNKSEIIEITNINENVKKNKFNECTEYIWKHKDKFVATIGGILLLCLVLLIIML